ERTVLRLRSVDDDPSALGKRIPLPAVSQQNTWRAALDRPVLNFAVLLDVEIQPGMRVGPLHLHHFAFEPDLLGRIELGRKGMVGQHWKRRRERAGYCQNPHQFVSSHESYSLF